MTFNTYLFIFAFLPACFLLYFACNHLKKYTLANISLIIMSSLFYLYGSIYSMLVVWASIVVNYAILQWMKRSKAPKAILIVGIVLNCMGLLSLKYCNFFIDNVNGIFHSDFNLLKLILPLGISYYTFQQIAYLVDNYRGEVPEYSFIEYSLFILFFPKAIAGPILFHSDIMPQFQEENRRKINADNVAKGLYAISIGMAKKVLLADTFGKFVDFYYGDIASMNSTLAILAMIGYTFQIYFDFSGYCDMATGICLLFNIEIPTNFNSPYKSYSVIEFWDRWHITLTRFFTKYVYIPLGGSRRGTVRTYVNTLIVFLVSGLWHGAEWSFVLWGLMHGIMLILNKMFRQKIETWNKVFSWFITFGFVNVAWIFFRANDLSQAMQVIKQIAQCNFGDIGSSIAQIFALPEVMEVFNVLHLSEWMTIKLPYFMVCSFFILALVVILNGKNVIEQVAEFKPTVRKSIFTAILMVWSILSFTGVGTFLYSGF